VLVTSRRWMSEERRVASRRVPMMTPSTCLVVGGVSVVSGKGGRRGVCVSGFIILVSLCVLALGFTVFHHFIRNINRD
jgi:hypothetical protein